MWQQHSVTPYWTIWYKLNSSLLHSAIQISYYHFGLESPIDLVCVESYVIKMHRTVYFTLGTYNFLLHIPWKIVWSWFTRLIIQYAFVTGFDKSGFHTHNGKADFSPPLNFYINELTIHLCIIANGSLVWFSWACFSCLSDMFKCSCDLQIAVVWPTDKHPLGLANKLATICDI